MWHLLLLLTIIATVVTSQVRAETLDCTGHHRYHATGTGYYPSNDPMEGGFYDMHGHRLHTLQAWLIRVLTPSGGRNAKSAAVDILRDFLERRSNVVDVAMDNHAGIAYDTKVCIPELNHKYHRVIDFRVRDTGSAFAHKGHSRIDICVRNRYASYDNTINGPLTLVFH